MEVLSIGFGSLLLFRVENAVRRRFAARKLPSESSDVPQHGSYLGGASSQLPTLLELHVGHGPSVRGTAGRLPVGCGRAGYGGTREPAFVGRNFKRLKFGSPFRCGSGHLRRAVLKVLSPFVHYFAPPNGGLRGAIIGYSVPYVTLRIFSILYVGWVLSHFRGKPRDSEKGDPET